MNDMLETIEVRMVCKHKCGHSIEFGTNKMHIKFTSKAQIWPTTKRKLVKM